MKKDASDKEPDTNLGKALMQLTIRKKKKSLDNFRWHRIQLQYIHRFQHISKNRCIPSVKEQDVSDLTEFLYRSPYNRFSLLVSEVVPIDFGFHAL